MTFRNRELPDYVTSKWLRFTFVSKFVSTYVTFVSQTENPWDIRRPGGQGDAGDLGRD